MLDSYIQRLQNITPFNIHQIQKDGTHNEWFLVTGEIINDLVVRDIDLALQVQTISAQIAHWGRLAAQAKRIWEIEERGYRTWKARFYIKVVQEAEKKPTEKMIESLYRADPEYQEWQQAMERAEEAYTATESILNAFKAKRDMLRAAVYRNRDDGSVTLSV